MKIRGYQLKHNEYIPFYVKEYLKERYEALERILERKYGHSLEISVSISHQSESAYIVLYKGRFNDYEIRISNHDIFSLSNHDENVFLSDFENWIKCRDYILKERLPKIVKQLSKQ